MRSMPAREMVRFLFEGAVSGDEARTDGVSEAIDELGDDVGALSRSGHAVSYRRVASFI
jgi:hypothetical protein